MDRLISSVNHFLAENHERMPTFDRAIHVIRRDRDVLEFSPDADRAVVFHASFFGDSKLSLELHYLRGHHGSRQGREYAQDVDYLVRNFFDPRYRGVFYVGNDISRVTILEPMIVTKAMFENSRLIADMFGSDSLPEGMDACFLEQKIDRILDFGPEKKVLRALSVGEFAVLANTPNDYRSEQLGLITRYWYKVVYPMYFPKITTAFTEPSEVYFTTVGLYVSLSMWTVLTNDDVRSMYMRFFGLGPCIAQNPVARAEYERRVRDVRNMKVVDMFSGRNDTILETMSHCHHVSPETTVGDFVAAAKRKEHRSFFDYFVLMAINSSIFVQIHERLEEVGTFSPCRPIRA